MKPLRFLTVLPFVLCASVANAAGMTSHATMADLGRQYLPEGVLKQILTVHRPALLAGALFPDGGYGSGAAFPADRDLAEHAHWGQFHLGFIAYLRQIGCGEQVAALVKLPAPAPALPGGTVQNPVGTVDLAGLTDECGELIAYALGDAAHGITDETWDAQFEPEVRDHGEDPNLAAWLGAGGFWGPLAPESPLRAVFGAQYDNLGSIWAQTPMNGIEYAMDVIAIVEHNLAINSPLLVTPPTDRLMAVFANSHFKDRDGKTTVAREAVERANAFSRGAVQAQADTAPADYQRVRAHMPWASNNYFLSDGGFVPSGKIVSGMYEYLWALLIGGVEAEPAPRIVGHYPGHNATGVVLRAGDDNWVGHRLMHVFMDANIDPDSIEAPGAFALFDESGTRAPIKVHGGHGWSRDWSHSARIELTAPLKKNQRYTAVVTTKVKDWNGKALARPYVWEFVTAP